MSEKADELRRIAAILEAWAENIRAEASLGNGGGRADRTAAMADVLVVAAETLRGAGAGDGLHAAICAASAIPADGVPEGYDLARVYTDGHEVVVCGEPAEHDAAHDCEEMGCGPSAHVIYRATRPDPDGAVRFSGVDPDVVN